MSLPEDGKSNEEFYKVERDYWAAQLYDGLSRQPLMLYELGKALANLGEPRKAVIYFEDYVAACGENTNNVFVQAALRMIDCLTSQLEASREDDIVWSYHLKKLQQRSGTPLYLVSRAYHPRSTDDYQKPESQSAG